MPRAKSSEAGFSLVELMVALVIFAVGILAVGQLTITSRRHSNYGREETMAVSLTQEIKERIYSTVFADVKTAYDDVDTDDVDTINDYCDEWAEHIADLFGASGRGTIQVYDNGDDASLPPGLYRVEVVVAWTSGPNTHEIPLTWLMSKMGVS